MPVSRTIHNLPKTVDLYEEGFNALKEFLISSTKREKDRVASGSSSDTVKFNEGLFSQDREKSLAGVKDTIMAALVVPILNDYLHLIKENKLNLCRLAIKITKNLHVWAEIKEGDQMTHNKLLLIESEINSKYFESTQIFLDSMIVDEADNIAIPSLYQEVNH